MVKKRFFIDLDDKLKTKTEIVYPSINPKKMMKKKKTLRLLENLMIQKVMTFLKSIIKILNEFNDWKFFFR